MPDLLPITVGPSIGPVFVRGDTKRDHYAHELAETCSLTDRVFQDTSLTVNFGFADYKYSNSIAVNVIPAHEPV
ncbi:MAG TPA: hypothetical protein VHA52_09770, partial [Candidatus Babeliaceae bacterium]|nr:hypothetical protein [Candidatus Babeliaceae bacterium]